MPRRGKRSRAGSINVASAPQVQAAVAAAARQAADCAVEAEMPEVVVDNPSVAHGPMDVDAHEPIVILGHAAAAPRAAAVSGRAAAELVRLAEFGGVGASRRPVVVGTARDRQRSVRMPSTSPPEQPATATEAARPLSSEEDAEARAVAAELLEAQIGDRRTSASSLRVLAMCLAVRRQEFASIADACAAFVYTCACVLANVLGAPQTLQKKASPLKIGLCTARG